MSIFDDYSIKLDGILPYSPSTLFYLIVLAEIVTGRKSGEVPNFTSLKSETKKHENEMS